MIYCKDCKRGVTCRDYDPPNNYCQGGILMKTSEKVLDLAVEVENLCIDVGFDFDESFDHSFAEIRREVENLESNLSHKKEDNP